MNIRELVKCDLGELLDLYGHLHATDSPLPEQKHVERVWDEVLSNQCIKYFGNLIDGKLISSCTISIIPNLTRSCRPYGVIENVVTHREFRQLGYGRAVLNAALVSAWDNDCYKVMLMTGRRDEETIRFYESVGFTRNGKEAFVAVPSFQ